MTAEQQESFVGKRRRLVRHWRWVGPLMVLAIVALGVGLFVRVPLMVNPTEVASRLQGGSLEPTTMKLMAAMVPILFLVCLGLLLALVFFVHVAFGHERRYLEIIDGRASTRSGPTEG